MKTIDLNQLRDRAYKCARAHGFHDEELSNEHCLCLIISELMEAVEADRTGYHANKDEFEVWIDGHDGSNEAFAHAFKKYLKDTVSDELADAAIRLLDLAGLRNIVMNDRFIIAYVVSKKKTFTENIYAILKDIVNYKYSFEECLNYAIRQVFELASFYDIDIMWHIEQKMKYNELRPVMHGKKY